MEVLPREHGGLVTTRQLKLAGLHNIMSLLCIEPITSGCVQHVFSPEVQLHAG